MNKKNYIIYIILSLFLFGCIEEKVDPNVLLNQSEIEVSAKGIEEVQVSFESALAWTVEVQKDSIAQWVYVTPEKGEAGLSTVSVRVRKNTMPVERRGYVHVKSDYTKKTIVEFYYLTF